MNVNKLQNLAMNDNGFIFDPNTGYSYTANETGIMILRKLASGLEKEEVRAAVMDMYEVSEDNFNSDFEHYMLMLESLDMIEF